MKDAGVTRGMNNASETLTLTVYAEFTVMCKLGLAHEMNFPRALAVFTCFGVSVVSVGRKCGVNLRGLSRAIDCIRVGSELLSSLSLSGVLGDP